MDASCKIQRSIHVLLCLIYKLMCPGFWVHISFGILFYGKIMCKKHAALNDKSYLDTAFLAALNSETETGPLTGV